LPGQIWELTREGELRSEKIAEEEGQFRPHSVIGILNMDCKHPNGTA
jgi:hypothetical protein